MSEWQEYRLDEIGQIVGGGTPSSKVDTYWAGGVGWITPADLSGYQFKHISNGSRNITELGLKKSSAKLHPKNTVLMTSRAPIGYLVIADKPVATNQGFQSIRCNKDIADFNFIYYLLSAYKEGIASIASGATFPELSGRKVKQYKIKLPSLSTQRKIAKILSNYDDLIENNLKRIMLLEESARLTYEEWFLRFRIDGKKLEIDPKSGLPFGWENSKNGNVCGVSGGGTPSKSKDEYWTNGSINWFSPTDLSKAKSLCVLGSKTKTNKLGISKSSAKLLSSNSFMMSSRATIGLFGLIEDDFSTNQGFINITPHRVEDKYYLLHNLISRVQEFKNYATGATFPEISKGKFKPLSIVWPEESVTTNFNDVCSPMYSEIFNLTNQNKLLKEARDILLPRLMTGMIDTDDMDIAV